MDLILPLQGLAPAASLGLALLVGVGFGAALEQGGLGDARKLTGQFYLRDLTVFKVMFTAIVTAMLGLYWLEWVGLLDGSLLLVPPTYLVPQLVGGLIFGAGFVTAGYCPGTSCVAGVSGRWDGVAALGGMILGIALYGEAFPLIRRLVVATPMPGATLPNTLGIPPGMVVGGIALLALAAFALIERVEAGRGR